MGPNRDLTTPDEAPGCAELGLRVKWRVPLAAAPMEAGAFASVVVVGGKLFTLTINGCEARDAQTGALLWTSWSTAGIGHSTPAVCGQLVYVYDARGVLSCLSATNGNVLWAQTVSNHVSGARTFDNNSQSPLVTDGKVFVFAAGQTNCALAFNATNGALIWKGQNCSLMHASPVIATYAGVRQLICQLDRRLVALAPEDGQFLWAQTNSCIYTTPVPHGSWLVAPEQNRGLLKVDFINGRWAATQAWTSANFKTTWTLPVVKDGFIYEVCAPNYVGGILRCIRLADGAVQWSTNDFGRGSVILAGTRLVATAESGWVNVINLNPQRYDLVARCHALTNLCFNLPAVAEGLIYVRNDASLACLSGQSPVVGELSSRGQGKYALTIRSADGSGLDSHRVPGIAVQVASSLTSNSTWAPFTAPRFLQNGVLLYTNLPPPTRFFRVIETNATR